MQGRRRAGLEVSLRRLLQIELIQRQIGNRLAQPAVLELKVLQPKGLRSLNPSGPRLFPLGVRQPDKPLSHIQQEATHA